LLLQQVEKERVVQANILADKVKECEIIKTECDKHKASLAELKSLLQSKNTLIDQLQSRVESLQQQLDSAVNADVQCRQMLHQLEKQLNLEQITVQQLREALSGANLRLTAAQKSLDECKSSSQASNADIVSKADVLARTEAELAQAYATLSSRSIDNRDAVFLVIALAEKLGAEAKKIGGLKKVSEYRKQLVDLDKSIKWIESRLLQRENGIHE
jgi:chromosome segregation ATPase